MNEQYYRLRLDDYASPSFVSSYKDYYGTLKDIDALIQALEADDQSEHFTDLRTAYEAFIAGNHKVTHSVAFSESKFLEPVEVIQSQNLHFSDLTWHHKNIWDYVYYMRCEEADVQVMFFRVDGETEKCYRAALRGLQYGISEDDYKDAGQWFWGFPHMLEYDQGKVYNRLYLPDIEPQEDDAIDFSAFCEEIFGEG